MRRDERVGGIPPELHTCTFRVLSPLLAAAVLASFALAFVEPASAQDGQATSRQPRARRISFANTDVADILQLIGRYYHVNMVFPAQTKIPISVNGNAAT